MTFTTTFDVCLGKPKLNVVKLARQGGFIFANLILRWAVWGFLGVLRIFKIFDYLFLVYPGSPDDLDGYCPRRLARSWFFSQKPTIGGFISKGQAAVRGLCLVTPNTAGDFAEKDICENIRKRLTRLNNLIGSRAVAIAGQVPGLMSRNGVPIRKPFVRGNRGTVFCIMETISTAAKKQALDLATASVAVVGVGYVGSSLLSELRKSGLRAVGLDIETRGDDLAELINNGVVPLSRADIIVINLIAHSSP